MAQVKLEGARIMWDGWLRPAILERMRAGGATDVYGLPQKPTLMVSGNLHSDKALKARGRGIPIIDVAQLEVLLTDGVLELEGEAAPVVALDESVAELRAVFDGEPTPERWARCLEIFEACDEERVEDLLAYAQPLISRWDKVKMGAWAVTSQHPITAGAPPAWAKVRFADELRVAPPAWIFELAQGRYHPKHAIIRALILEGMNLNGKLGAAIFASPHMRAVRRVNLGAKELPPSFYKALRTSEVMRTVEELWVYDVREVYQEAWTPADHTFDALKRLRLGSGDLSRAAQLELPCLARAKQGKDAPWASGRP
jgi:hypothetical protein